MLTIPLTDTAAIILDTVDCGLRFESPWSVQRYMKDIGVMHECVCIYKQHMILHYK